MIVLADAERDCMSLLKNKSDEVICFNNIFNGSFLVDFKENREIYEKR